MREKITRQAMQSFKVRVKIGAASRWVEADEVPGGCIAVSRWVEADELPGGCIAVSSWVEDEGSRGARS